LLKEIFVFFGFILKHKNLIKLRRIFEEIILQKIKKILIQKPIFKIIKMIMRTLILNLAKQEKYNY